MVDILVLAKMMKSVLMLLLLTICQPPPILKNVLRIHEMTILLVSLSSKAFLINIQDLIHSLNNKYFQDFVQIFKPYWKLVIWHVTCILGAQEHKITSHGCISTTKFDVFQYYSKISYLLIGGKNLISSLILSSSLLYKTSYGIAIPHFFVMQFPYYTYFSFIQFVFFFFFDYLLILRFWIVVLLPYPLHFMVLIS
jgi:hypothetical protein